MDLQRELEIIELIKKEVKPALGCTEPIAVSLAVARSCEALKEIGAEVGNVVVEVSANILKNGMGVGIPGTGMVGLHIAAALAVTCGRSSYGLEVLKDLTPEAIDAAKAMVDAGAIKVVLADTQLKLYIKATAYSGLPAGAAGDAGAASAAGAAGAQNCLIEPAHYAMTEIANNHDSIISVVRDGVSLLDHSHINPLNCAGSACTAVGGEVAPVEKTTLDYKLSVKEILQFAQEASFENIEFILDSVKLNKALADAGLSNDYGLKVGKTILASEHTSVFGSSIMTYAMAATAAASDARMAGCTLPAMSNSGSGNQGITVTMPVIAVAEKMNVSQEKLARALVLSHLIAIHIKGYLGKLSALCGCVIASTGSSCGIVYLHDGGYDQVCSAIKNMVGNITGMVCDGAKVGCALKVASGVSSSIQAAVLALDGICISSNDGIIEDCIEKTICNLGRIGAEGMQTTDKMILDIMVCK
ncbi:MAG: serine dehydratase subunit alpha family protein [Bacteroidales bacterium]|nr:serine dehydratase subunit alpha family protein [Bacteroidales bacterium]